MFKLTKYDRNPILKANPANDWESLCVLNPAVVYDDREGLFKMLYRAAGNDEAHRITLGLAVSTDGKTFTRRFDSPVLEPDENGADGGGCEDPRLVKMGEYYYLTYASRTFLPGQYWLLDKAKKYGFKPENGPAFLNTNGSVTHLAITKDLINFKKLGRMTDSRLDNRDAFIFPEKIGGKYYMLHRPMEYVGPEYGCKVPSIWLSSSDDLSEWDNGSLFATAEQSWESKKLGGSCPPIRTDKGWLLLYHGVDEADDAYRVGAFLLDLNDPAKILARTKDFIMEPEFDYETSGYYNGCVFPCGNVVVGDTLYVYYGAADKYCCLATCNLGELLEYLTGECAL